MFHSWKLNAPTVGIAVAFGMTVAAARVFSMIMPPVHWEPVHVVHVHHYVYGIFILAIAGYLALIFRGNRATTWIALLYGLGIGLTFDEFGMWMNPPFVRGVRWNTNGLTIVLFALAFAGLWPVLLRRRSTVTREVEGSALSFRESIAEGRVGGVAPESSASGTRPDATATVS